MNFFQWAMTPQGFYYISWGFAVFGVVICLLGLFGDRILRRIRRS
jgi:hypothetical protein